MMSSPTCSSSTQDASGRSGRTRSFFTSAAAVSAVDRHATAYPHRDAVHNLNINAVWLPNETIGHEETNWARDFHLAVKPRQQGAYLNFLDRDDHDQLPVAYDDATYNRLVALKDRYDPDNVFASNHNIRPSTMNTVPARPPARVRAPEVGGRILR